MALKALFTRADVHAVTQEFLDRIELAVTESLKDAGESWITDARNLRTYKDRTGNLRSSVGYLVLSRGKIISSNFSASGTGTGGSEGKREGSAYARKLARQFRGERFTLIGVAGMDYAVYVEAKGLDVITGSSNEAKKLLERHLKRILKK